jgi:hypothetical protein
MGFVRSCVLQNENSEIGKRVGSTKFSKDFAVRFPPYYIGPMTTKDALFIEFATFLIRSKTYVFLSKLRWMMEEKVELRTEK